MLHVAPPSKPLECTFPMFHGKGLCWNIPFPCFTQGGGGGVDCQNALNSCFKCVITGTYHSRASEVCALVHWEGSIEVAGPVWAMLEVGIPGTHQVHG